MSFASPTGLSWMEPVLAVHGPLTRDDLPGLRDRACRLLEESDAEVVVCVVGPEIAADAVAVDALARLELAARRLGRHIRLVGVSPGLRELLEFVGLDARLRIEPGGQAEQREEVRRVEEERHLGDTAV
jgi:ABC-type transporter Mla MlaB component